MLDKRQAIVELVSMTDKDFEPLFDFAFRLNHSHLITSHARWPLDYRSRVLAGARRVRESIRQTGAQWNEAFATQPFNELSESSRIIAEEVLQVLDIAWLNFVGEVDKLKADVGTMRQNVIDGYNANAFYAKLAVDIGGAIVRDIPFDSYAQNFVSFVERTGNRILDPLTGEENSFSEWLRSVSQSLSTIAESVGAWLGKQWDWPSDNTSKALSQLADIFRQMAREYDRVLKRPTLHAGLFKQRVFYRAVYGATTNERDGDIPRFQDAAAQFAQRFVDGDLRQRPPARFTRRHGDRGRLLERHEGSAR